jgi:hypothetical protein
MLPVSLDCSFLIAPSVFSNVYLNNYSPTSITYSHHPDLHTKYFKLSPGVTPVSNIVFPHNAICVGHHYAQTNTNNVNKTLALLQTTGGKYEPNIIFADIVMDITTRNSERKDTD